ncbi:MAG: hypothetical protein A2277_03450 [Desulfobacterales bacterium RIFOXYA12_FULL_46_15]|nr:MAG: hypothetical protein A2277_03450 [Desulfobacterales bacterium RIFOXYA12_FULL_46_15]
MGMGNTKPIFELSEWMDGTRLITRAFFISEQALHNENYGSLLPGRNNSRRCGECFFRKSQVWVQDSTYNKESWFPLVSIVIKIFMAKNIFSAYIVLTLS